MQQTMNHADILFEKAIGKTNNSREVADVLNCLRHDPCLRYSILKHVSETDFENDFDDHLNTVMMNIINGECRWPCAKNNNEFENYQKLRSFMITSILRKFVDEHRKRLTRPPTGGSSEFDHMPDKKEPDPCEALARDDLVQVQLKTLRSVVQMISIDRPWVSSLICHLACGYRLTAACRALGLDHSTGTYWLHKIREECLRLVRDN